MDDVRCNWHTVGMVEGDRGWSCPMCPNPADIDRLRDELEQERQRRQDDLIGQQHRDERADHLQSLIDAWAGEVATLFSASMVTKPSYWFAHDALFLAATVKEADRG